MPDLLWRIKRSRGQRWLHGVKPVLCCRVQLCHPLDCSPPGSYVHGIFQAKVLEWLPVPSPGDLPDPGIELTFPVSPAFQADTLAAEPSGKPNLNELNKQIREHVTEQTCLLANFWFPFLSWLEIRAYFHLWSTKFEIVIIPSGHIPWSTDYKSRTQVRGEDLDAHC